MEIIPKRIICHFALICFICGISFHLAGQPKFYDNVDYLMKKYVFNGLVDYSSLKRDQADLDSILLFLGTYDYTTEDSITQKAYLINAYNLFVLQALRDNYPVQSPMNINGFYNRIKHFLAGRRVTLDEIENNMLRGKYNDNRLHFVLVCGSKGCPPILAEAYRPEILDRQMETQTSLTINNPLFVRVDSLKKKLSVSQLFNWYKGDFTNRNGSITLFLNKYRKNKLQGNYEISYYEYDWSINDYSKLPIDSSLNAKKNASTGLQAYTPSVLLGKGKWQYKFFNNLYSQTQGYDLQGNRVEYNSRSDYFTSINQFLMGVSSKLDIGANVWIKSVRIDPQNSSPFALLKFENSSNTRTAISSAGPIIRIAPFANIPHLSIQSTFLIPIANDQEGVYNGKPYLSADSYFLITQVYYDQAIGNKFQLFFQFSPWLSINRKYNLSTTNLSTPIDVFLSWFPNKKTTLYFQQEFWPYYGNSGFSSWFRQEGIGFKYEVIPGLMEVEILYSSFTMGVNSGAGQTYNFGIRIVK